MRPLLSIAALAVLVTACATAVSDRPYCPALERYTPEFQARAGEALDRLAVDDPLRRLVEDYGELRARLRVACRV